MVVEKVARESKKVPLYSDSLCFSHHHHHHQLQRKFLSFFFFFFFWFLYSFSWNINTKRILRVFFLCTILDIFFLHGKSHEGKLIKNSLSLSLFSTSTEFYFYFNFSSSSSSSSSYNILRVCVLLFKQKQNKKFS